LSAFIEGLGFGFVLAIMTGPIFFVLLQTALEEGFRSGMLVVLGIFISDALFVGALYFGLGTISTITNSPDFDFYLQMIGGVILVGFGLGTLLGKPPEIPSHLDPSKVTGDDVATFNFKKSPALSLWFKGFAVNTFNPTTVLFWVGAATIRVDNNGFNSSQFLLFGIGILIVILITDSAKAWLAKIIRWWLKPKYMLILRKISGTALLLFGVGFLLRGSGLI